MAFYVLMCDVPLRNYGTHSFTHSCL